MSLVIVAANEALERRVRSLLSHSSAHTVQRWDGPLADGADVKAVADRRPAVVILGPPIGRETAFGLAAQFDRLYPSISLLVVAKPGGDAWQRALATGVRGVIARNVSNDELRAHLGRALEVSHRRAQAARAAAEAPRARVITVISPRGGSGKTIVSTNLAVGLAARDPGNVVLLDLDLQFGDVAYALALTPQNTMTDAASTFDELDATTLKVFLTRHESGLYALCAPEEPEAGEQVPVAVTSTVIRLIASQFGYVVIDTAAGLGGHTLAALKLSTDVVLVADMDVPSVHRLRKALDALDGSGELVPRRHFVLNRADSRVSLSKAEVVAAVGAPFDLEIPSSRHVPISLNRGRPLLLDNPHSPAARRLARVVERFAGTPAGRSCWRLSRRREGPGLVPSAPAARADGELVQSLRG